MFESGGASTADLEGLLSALSGLEGAVDDTERVDQLDLLERVKSACAAAQVRVTVDLAESQQQMAEQWREHARAVADAGDFETWRRARAMARAASCPEADDTTDPTRSTATAGQVAGRRCGTGRPARPEAGVATQVALARRESPHAGSRLVRLAYALTHEMPFLLELLERGVLSERRASLVVRECAALSMEQRARVDAELGHRVGEQLGRLSERELTARVRAISYRLDAQAVVDRAAYAERERRVTLRPAPDTMCWLTALVPATQGVGVLAALTRAADSARVTGDVRGRGQVMADTLVERVTGQPVADAVPVEVQLVVTDRALLSGDGTPARLAGYGTVPAGWARRLLTQTEHQTRSQARTPTTASGGEPDLAAAAPVWLRRLYTHPADGTLVAMDSQRRVFDGALRRFLLARDGGICRTPGCGAPIRQVDHVTAHARGGRTSATNGQGLCVRCNLVKELLGWHARVVAAPGPMGHRDGGGDTTHTVEITTPTGHRYSGAAPPLVPEDPGISDSPIERALELALAA
jgi:hypothetical protein